MKFIENIKLKNKNCKVYKINSSVVYIFKKLHLEILKNTPLSFDCAYEYSRFKEDIKNKKEDIKNKKDYIFLMYYRNKPVAFSFMSVAKFDKFNLLYIKRYKLTKKQLPFLYDLNGVGVLEKFRGLGIQDYFIKLRIDYAKKLGQKYFFVSINPKNMWSLKNAKKNDFRETEKYINYEGNKRVFLRKDVL
ncbi:MAG: hypothetical protein PHR26_01245 [Candidatus ainarchaeum sp.]|nr:hypothetical protein [Candidatus ainarchaeum sp.]MDD3976267.1 hypothetical protein [Candidatus ainarchaeum sp.]